MPKVILKANQKAKIENVLRTISRMKPIHMLSGLPLQARAPSYLIFELRKSGSSYSLNKCQSAGPMAIGPEPSPDGLFSFVILADNPGTVFCGIPVFIQDTLVAEYQRAWRGRDISGLAIEGHTSISRGAPVLCAGELVLKNGILTRWGNASGHYKPGKEFCDINLLPIVKLLLPENLFVDHIEEKERQVAAITRSNQPSPHNVTFNEGYVTL